MNLQEWEMLCRNYPAMELKDNKGQSKGVWLTPPARLAFEKLTEPEGGKHTCALLFHPSADLTPLFEAARAAAAGKWGQNIPRNLRSPFKEQKDLADKYDGFMQDGFFVNCASKFAPNFYASDAKTKIALISDHIWSGCYVRAGLSTYTYDKDGEGKAITPGVGFGLSFIQFFADGEKLSGGIDATEYLQPVTGVSASAPAAAPSAAKANGAAPAAAQAARGALF